MGEEGWELMQNNQVLNTISDSIEMLSLYATQLADQYVIDSPVVPLDKNNQTFVRIGRCKTGKTLLYSTEGGVEELLTAAPIKAKVSFLEIFEQFFETYGDHAARFWRDVDRVTLKCSGCVTTAMAAAKRAAAKVEAEERS